MNSGFSKILSSIWDFIKLILQALLIALILRTFLFQSFNIPTSSMVPSLLINDFLFVSKYSYGFSRHSLPFSFPPFSGRFFASEPKRGDVIVFRFPKDNTQDYIKRLIGLPGDRVQMIAGRLYINGTIVPRERIEDFAYFDTDFGRTYFVPQYIETLPNGVKHRIIESHGDDWRSDNTVEYVVPEGHYFMMGDNRDSSDDSRYNVGHVPFENLIGRAEIIYLSVEEQASAWQAWQWPQTLRTNRLFQPIR